MEGCRANEYLDGWNIRSMTNGWTEDCMVVWMDCRIIDDRLIWADHCIDEPMAELMEVQKNTWKSG